MSNFEDVNKAFMLNNILDTTAFHSGIVTWSEHTHITLGAIYAIVLIHTSHRYSAQCHYLIHSDVYTLVPLYIRCIQYTSWTH